MENEFDQGKLIIKTLVVLVILSLFASAVFMLFFPKAAASVAADLGMEEISIGFTKTSYERSGDINSLAEILQYEIDRENHEEVAKYGIYMISSTHYEEYVEYINENGGSYIGYDIYIETNLLKSLYICGSTTEVKSIIASRVITGYETFGVGISLASEVVAAGDSEMAEDIMDIFDAAYSEATDMQKYNMILETSILIEVYQDTIEIWAERLNELNEKFAQ